MFLHPSCELQQQIHVGLCKEMQGKYWKNKKTEKMPKFKKKYMNVYQIAYELKKAKTTLTKNKNTQWALWQL